MTRDTKSQPISAAGPPLGSGGLRSWYRRGHQVVVVGCAILFARDLALVLTGAPARLWSLPRFLLFAELTTAGTAIAGACRAGPRASDKASPRAEISETPASVAPTGGNGPTLTGLPPVTPPTPFL